MCFKKGNNNNFLTLTDSFVSVILFARNNCKKCETISSIIEEISKTLENNTYIYVDVEESPELAVSNMIIDFPSVLIMNYGVRIKRIMGVRDKDYYFNEIEKIMKSGL